MQGTIFDIQRFCINDGPGIRTTVFLKGCMLDCKWCHNPESKSIHTQLSYSEHKCLQCKKCASICQHDVHIFENQTHYINFDSCIQCGTCINECPNDAIKIVGINRNVDEIVNILEKDRNFYITSGGGITISGGEPMLQATFATAIAKEAKKRRLHVTLETSGFGKLQEFIEIAPYVDLFLFDYKITNAKQHYELTGVNASVIERNRHILETLKKEIIIRCPMIPSYNINDEHLKGIVNVYFESVYVRGVELLPYHTMGASKSINIGKQYEMKDVDVTSDAYVIDVIKKLKEMGVLNVKKG